MRPPDSVTSNITVGLCFNRQCCRNQHYRFVAQASSGILVITTGLLLTGSDGYDNTAGLWQDPAVMAKTTLSVCGSSRQCHLGHHCRFVANRQWRLRQHFRFVSNRQWWLRQHHRFIANRHGPFVYYCFIINLNFYFFVGLGFTLYTLRRRQVHQY